MSGALRNASRLGGPDDWKARLQELFDDPSRAAGAEREFGREVFDTLSARAKREFPDEVRRVADVRVALRGGGGLQVYALSRPGARPAAPGRSGAARSSSGPPGVDPLAGPRDLLDRTNLSPGVDAAVREILDLLREAPGRETPGDGHLARAGELVVVHAVTEPEEVVRGRKPEVWAAGALHAASLTTFLGHADPDRLTTEAAARLFQVSAASVSDRSVALRRSWELALEAGAHPRFPGASAGVVRLATASLAPSGGHRGSPLEPGGRARARKALAEALGRAHWSRPEAASTSGAS